MKKEHPILFSTEMVQAILKLIKTMTRRLAGLEKINEQPENWKFVKMIENPDLTHQVTGKRKIHPGYWAEFEWASTKPSPHASNRAFIKCDYGKPGDLLWVRETFFNCKDFKTFPLFTGKPDVLFKADDTFIGEHSWKPCIHMPKAAARIWLEVAEIKAERLQEISEDDALREGVEPYSTPDGEFYTCYLCTKQGHSKTEICGDYGEQVNAVSSFYTLWDSINGENSFKLNPWVWVVKFKVLSTTGKPAEEVRIPKIGTHCICIHEFGENQNCPECYPVSMVNIERPRIQGMLGTVDLPMFENY